jgi:predicted Zn finger-like uncharacterized protein
MNDITRCPNCQTAFRVTEAQLQAHRGKVRCGRCAFVFNANECLEIEQKVEIVSEVTTPSPVKVTKTIEATEVIEVREPIQPSAAQIMAAAITAPLTPEQDKPAPLITPAIAEPIEPPSSLSEPNETAALAPSALAEAIEIPTRHSTLNETAALVVPPPIADSIEPRPSRPKRIVLDSDEPKVDFASIGMTTISEPEVETMAEAPLAPPKPQSQAAFETAHGYHPILTEDDDALLAQQPERSKWQGLFIAMSIILMLSFAAQLAYQQRTNISMEFPWLRPKMILACQTLGCSMPLPKNAELLRSEWSELSYVPEFPSIIQLNATLRNLAQYEQALPLLEVTLTDDQERIVLKKVFKPSEYLSGHDKKRLKFDAQDDLRAFLQIDLGELHSTAYSIYWFYP